MGKVNNVCACVLTTLVVAIFFFAVTPALSQDAVQGNSRDKTSTLSNSLKPGAVLLSQRKYQEAESYFKSEMAKDDRSIGVEIGFAISLVRQKKFPEAIEFLKTAAQKTPSSVVLADLFMEAVLRQPVEMRKKEDMLLAMTVATNCADQLSMTQRSIRIPSQDTDEENCKHEVEKYFQRYPQLSCGGETEVFLRKWLTKMFAGDQEVCNILCDELTVTPVSRAHHRYLNNNEHAAIELPAFNGNGFDESSLALFCFEVLNIENCKGFARLSEAAARGMIPEEDYIIDTLKLEHTAILKVRKFYLDELLPKMRLDGIESDPNNWYASFPLGFAYFIRVINSGHSKETWDYYAKHYRRLYAYGYWRGGLVEDLSPIADFDIDE